ncbi:MAG: PAS domain-containing sensor histidine kinase [Candidatus Saccharimonadales bacterium]
MLSLISQLATIENRQAAVKRLAAELGVTNLVFFVRDEESDTMTPVSGLAPPQPFVDAWKTVLTNAPASGRYSASVALGSKKKLSDVTVLSHGNKLFVAFTGAHASEEKLSSFEELLPILSSLFYFEKFIERTHDYIKHTEASAIQHQTIAQKLDVTRKNLQVALAEKNAEIYERIKSQSALAESEQRFRFMAESLSTMIFTSKPSGELDYVSPQWTNYTGLPADLLKGKGLQAVLHSDDKDNVVDYWDRSYAAGTPIEQEVRLMRHDGVYRWHLSRADAMRNDAGEITMWVGSSTDIEDVKANMQKKLELEEKTEILTRQQKNLLELNAAKDEFIRLASHQLRTPATGVKMYIGMLIDGYIDQPTESQMRMLNHAYQSNDRQLHIIDDLLKVATVDAGKVLLNKELYNLEILVSDIIEELQHTVANRHQHIVFINPHKDISADIDRRYIRMVIENIIDNASKYSPDETTITINITQKMFKEITIIDQGVGIAKKDQSALFGKFNRIHNAMSVSAAGTGLGLYWAKEIISLHGGTITVTSKPNHGSTFIIKLP